MGQFIVKLRNHYLIWSSVVDAPICVCENETDVAEYIREKYGNEGLRELPRRMERVKAKGTSAHDDDSALDTIWLNRAGPDESTLTILGIYLHYCCEQPIKPEWVIPREVVLDDSTDTTLYDMVVAGWAEYAAQAP